VTAHWDAAQRHAEDRFRALECWKVGRTEQNPLGSADFWTVTDEVVFGFAICARFRGAWKCGAKRRSSEGLDGQRVEDVVWWALMHILEKWAKKSQRKRKRTDEAPGPTPKKPTTSGPSGHPGPSGQPEPLTRDSSIRTPAVNSTPAADPTPAPNSTPAAYPTPKADPTPAADPTPWVRPPVIASPPLDPLPVGPLPVGPLPVGPLPVGPLPVGPPPVADTLGGLYGGGLQGFDDHNPPAKWVAQSWLIWHHRAIYVANCVRYRNDDEDTLRILDFWWSNGTIRGPKLQDLSHLGRPGARYIGLL
jgi:hypothetical protein